MTVSLYVLAFTTASVVSLTCFYAHIMSSTLASFRQRATWSLLSCRGHPCLPESLEKWSISEELQDDQEGYFQAYLYFKGTWKFLEPFFAMHGYTLYQSHGPDHASLFPVPSVYEAKHEHSAACYPYARRTYEGATAACFTFSGAMRVFPARDLLGRDVIIKSVGDDKQSNELKIMQYLNSNEARADPRNHTIPIIEFLTFNKFTFVVMPRWDMAFRPQSETVDQIMNMALAFLEAFDFMHEHRIVHFDFLQQNTAMDVLYDNRRPEIANVRDDSTRYALIDFGQSIQYPLDTVLEEVQETRYFPFRLRGLPELDKPYNPFHVDILSLGAILQRYVRHIENIIPELGPFFDCVTAIDSKKCLTARQALDRFRVIKSNLTVSQRQAEFDTYLWNNGRVTRRRPLVNYPGLR